MSGTDTTTAEFSASHTEKITTGSDAGFCIGGYSASTIGLAVVALIIALLWTASVIGFVGALCKKKRKSCSSDSCETGTGWAGALIGFVVWIVVLALLIAVVCMWQWIGLLIFVVIFILFALAGWWMGCKDKKESCD